MWALQGPNENALPTLPPAEPQTQSPVLTTSWWASKEPHGLRTAHYQVLKKKKKGTTSTDRDKASSFQKAIYSGGLGSPPTSRQHTHTRMHRASQPRGQAGAWYCSLTVELHLRRC